jgi:hypothetical protein
MCNRIDSRADVSRKFLLSSDAFKLIQELAYLVVLEPASALPVYLL